MLEHMKTLPIDAPRVLVVACPEESLDHVMKFLKENGCEVDAVKLSGEECCELPELFPDDCPATRLKGLRCREDMTRRRLARMSGIPMRRLCAMENGRRPINEREALKLAKALNATVETFTR